MRSRTLITLLAGLGLVLALAALPVAARIGDAQEIPGPLSAAHAAKPGDAGCAQCHQAPGEISPAKCLACHVEIASRIAAKSGFHRDKAGDCAVCHAEHQGRNANIVPLDPADFDHAETGADLQGAHL
ncbi:MAG: cytochrome c family protein, partial [Candidatus Aminicenantes bacterium]|nr:cytochrome c family protein [Candidatus Aminicenantes bacterium]